MSGKSFGRDSEGYRVSRVRPSLKIKIQGSVIPVLTDSTANLGRMPIKVAPNRLLARHMLRV